MPGKILLNSSLSHNRWTDVAALYGGLLGSTAAPQRYMVHLCCIKAYEFAVFSAGYIRYQAGGSFLDGWLLHNG